MRKLYLILMFVVFSFWLLPYPANAAEIGSYVERIEVSLSGGSSSGKVLVPSVFSNSTTIYKDTDSNDNQESYLQTIEAIENQEAVYEKIGIKDSSVKLLTTIFFKQAELVALGGWNDVDKIKVHKGCQGTAMGDQNLEISRQEFINADYKISFPADPDCKIDLFFQQNSLDIDMTLKKATSSQKFDKTSYTFTIVDKPKTYRCNLQVYNSETDSLITQVDNDTPVKIVGTNIYMGDSSYVIFIDGESQYQNYGFFLPTQTTFGYVLGKLDVGNHTASIRTYDIASAQYSNTDICRINIPVFLKGATPTEIIEQPDDLVVGGAIDIETMPTIPLCDSITDPDMKAECEKCQGSGDVVSGVWTGLGCMPTNFSGIVSSLFTLFSGLLGGLVFLCLVSNGLKIMAARGNPEVLKKGQEAITACLVGFVVLVLSVLFLKIVGVNILSIPGWT